MGVHSNDDDDGVLLLVGSGRQAYREYLLDGLARHRPLWLIDEEPPGWQRRYLCGSCVAGQDGLLDAALAVTHDRKVAGVLTYDEMLVVPTAQVAETLGLPGLSVAAARNCRDKYLARTALTAAGLPQPRFALARSLDEAAEAAARIGYPVVVKPRGLGASVGVVKAAEPEGLPRAFAIADRASRLGPAEMADGVLMEEFLDGPEISVDAGVSGGEYQPFCLARKRIGPPPSFEETGHVVDARDPLAADEELRRLLASAHAALRVTDGITHTEVRLTSRGPVIIEVNARLGGDMIPYVGLLATGINPARVAADVATGTRPDTEVTAPTCAGVRFLYPPVDCRVSQVRLPDPGQVTGLLEARSLAGDGSMLRLPPRYHLGRYAYLIATGDGPGNCEAALDEASARAQLDYEPLENPELYDGRPW